MNARAGNPLNRLLGHGPAVLWAMGVGGILWIFHGYFRFMTPQGPDAVWREDLQNSLIVSTELFLLYNLPGVLALLLTAWATLSYLPRLRTATTGLKRAAQILVLVASIFGLIAAVGVVVLSVPPTVGGISFGVPVLGLALSLSGLAVIRDGTRHYGHPRLLGPLLMLLGVIGMFTLPLQPMVYALALLPLPFGTAVFAMFGAGWVVLAFSLRSQMRREQEPHSRDSPRTATSVDP
jgi:hypothetical protein